MAKRTPMQWSSSSNAGFSATAPWLPVDDRYKTYNVESEKQDPNSILNYYHQLLGIRHTNEALLDGQYIAMNQDDPNVLSYLRQYKNQNVLVVLNMSGAAQTVRLDLASWGVRSKTAATLLSSFAAPKEMDVSELTIEPFGAWIAEIK